MTSSRHLGVKLQQEMKRLNFKPGQIAVLFDVKPPSVYDWIEHGRIHKKHFAKLVEVFGRPLHWWLDMSEGSTLPPEARDPGPPPFLDADPRHTVLLELFDGLPNKEQDELIKSLKEKKQHYDAVIEELLERRRSA